MVTAVARFAVPRRSAMVRDRDRSVSLLAIRARHRLLSVPGTAQHLQLATTTLPATKIAAFGRGFHRRSPTLDN